MRTSTQLAGTALVALLALTACGGDTEADAENTDAAATEQPADADSPAAEEQDAAADEPESRDDGLDPEAMDLVERENEVFERFLEAVGTEEEAEVQSELEEIYAELDELYPDIESIEDVPPELQMLGFLQYMADRGISIDEVMGGDESETPDEDEGAAAAALGESVPVHDRFTDELIGEVTVNEILPGFECPRVSDWEPQSGAFFVIDVSVTGEPDADSVPRISSSAFHLIDEDGMVHEPVAGNPATNACVEDAELLPDARPGATSEGLVVMDVDVEAGELILDNVAEEVRWQF